MNREKILIFIPMYNCEKQIPRVIDRIAAIGEDQKLFSEVILVDNRSSDQSVECAKTALPKLSIPAKILRNHENYSLGGSHKVAFRYALEHGFDAVVVLHGDDQGDIADIVPYLQTVPTYDSMLGSRFSKGSRLTNYSRFRIFGNHVFNALFSIISGHRVKDLGAGLNYYRTGYLASEFYMPFPNDLTFNVYLLLYGIYAKSNFCFFPLSWREDDQVSNAKLVAQTKRMLKLGLAYVFHKKTVFSTEQNSYCQIPYSYEIVGNYHPEGNA